MRLERAGLIRGTGRPEVVTVPDWQKVADQAKGGQLIDIVSRRFDTHLRAVVGVSVPGIEPKVPGKTKSVIDDIPGAPAMEELAGRMKLGIGEDGDNRKALTDAQILRTADVLEFVRLHTDLLPSTWSNGFSSLLAETEKAHGQIAGAEEV